jgi:hypothetical protein
MHRRREVIGARVSRQLRQTEIAGGEAAYRRNFRPAQAKHAGHFKKSAAEAEEVLGGDHGGAPGVRRDEPLKQLIAFIPRHVNVDVGRFASLGTDEPFEQEAVPQRVDMCDPEAVGHY